MKEYYAKIKPCCGNCKHECGVQLDPKEVPRWYYNKSGAKSPLPDDRGCDDFEFDCNIIRPTIVRGDYLIKDNQDYIYVKPLKI